MAVLLLACFAALGALVWARAEHALSGGDGWGRGPWGCRAGGALAGPGTGCEHVYVARPGDTIWSVAVRYGGGGDPRPLVDQLEAEIGGGVLQPGQQLVLP